MIVYIKYNIQVYESHNSNTDDDYNSEEIIKKEARELGDDTDFEVQEILREYVITQKGNAAKNILSIILILKGTNSCINQVLLLLKFIE